MKSFKITIVAILGLIGIALLIPAFTARSYAVEKEIIIKQPKSIVFRFIKLLKNQERYSVWAKMDPDMKRTAKGQDGTPGFTVGWESENPNVGRGEQEIKSIEEGHRINYELRFYEPFEAVDQAYMTTESLDANQTKVKWGFQGSMDYPMNAMLLFMDMDKMVGTDLEEGLQNLKVLLEQTKKI